MVVIVLPLIIAKMDRQLDTRRLWHQYRQSFFDVPEAFKEDLIQKSVGWMLREVGKRDLKTEEAFLNQY